MELVIKSAGISITAAVICLLLRKTNAEFVPLLALAAVGAVIFMAADVISQIVDFVSDLSELSELSPTVISIVLKTVAISVITKIGTDICADAGQSAVSSCLELAGTLTAVYVALPLMRSVITMVQSLL
jgi:stage III sporulation protein AD